MDRLNVAQKRLTPLTMSKNSSSPELEVLDRPRDDIIMDVRSRPCLDMRFWKNTCTDELRDRTESSEGV